LRQYRGADKFLARPGRKRARKHVRDARDFNNIETRAVIKFLFPLQGKALKEIHAILTEMLASFLPGRAKDLSAPRVQRKYKHFHLTFFIKNIITFAYAVDSCYTGCNRRNRPDFGRVFLMLNYTEKPQNTYIQS